MNGLFLFGKYAFPPNLLEYCGPKGRVFFEVLKDSSKKELINEIRHLSLQFEGAVPYLRLIAGENNIKDEFDIRVVEAYWLGNGLLNRVKPSSLYYHIEERFRKKASSKDWQFMKELNNAKPFHNYHVFSIFSKVGLMGSGEKKAVLKTMENCRIKYGKIKKIAANTALVEYFPLEFDDFNLNLGEKTEKNFQLIDKNLKENDIVSLHWDYVCDKITPEQKNNLSFWTDYHIKVFNGQNR